MPYYAMLTNDIDGMFGADADKDSIITALQDDGNTDIATFMEDVDLHKLGAKVKMDSKYALLFGTDKQSSTALTKDVRAYFADLPEITLRVPKPKEWLACVTFIDTDKPGKSTKFQVVALVGSSALKAAGVDWTQEDSPPEPWETHAEGYVKAGGTKRLTYLTWYGRGAWG